MTLVSKIINKYSQSEPKYNILYNTRYIDFFISTLGHVKYKHYSIDKLNIFHSYDIYIADAPYLESIKDIYKQYLSKIIIIDNEHMTEHNDDLNCKQKITTYDTYRGRYPILFLATDMEQYLLHNNIYDRYLDPKQISDIITTLLKNE